MSMSIDTKRELLALLRTAIPGIPPDVTRVVLTLDVGRPAMLEYTYQPAVRGIDPPAVETRTFDLSLRPEA